MHVTTIYQCDRCGAGFDSGKTLSQVTLPMRNTIGVNTHRDICAACCKSLAAWWQQGALTALTNGTSDSTKELAK